MKISRENFSFRPRRANWLIVFYKWQTGFVNKKSYSIGSCYCLRIKILASGFKYFDFALFNFCFNPIISQLIELSSRSRVSNAWWFRSLIVLGLYVQMLNILFAFVFVIRSTSGRKVSHQSGAADVHVEGRRLPPLIRDTVVRHNSCGRLCLKQ